MKTSFKLIFALLVCFVSGCPRSTPVSVVDAGSDVLDVSHGPVTSFSDGTVNQ